MDFRLVVIFCVFFANGPAYSNADADAKWSYRDDETGPNFWSTLEGGELCGGTSQSPINIVTDSAVEQEYKPWVLQGYDSQDLNGPHPSQILNNGHTVQVNLEGDYLVSGAGLPSIYRAVQFHLHWGSDSTKGSDHLKDGKAYPAELHIVHYDTLNYSSVLDAVTEKDGLAVCGFFVEVGNHNPAWDPVINALPEVKDGGSYDFTAPFQLSALIPSDITKFYRYRGSLTNPGCYESVIWTVIEETIKLSEEQLSVLRTLVKVAEDPNKIEEGDPIVDNYRPVQPLNRRTVYAGYTSGEDSSCAEACNKERDESKPCQCDVLCRQRGDCCEDYEGYCLVEVCSHVPTFKNKMRKQNPGNIEGVIITK